MAGPIRKTNVSVVDRLENEPYRFSFYQAVRLLLARAAAEAGDAPDGNKVRRGRIGTVSNISDEPLRFRMQTALSFAPSEVIALRRRAPSGEEDVGQSDDEPIELEVGFWGLTGPAGALPNHYTQHVIDRVHVKDFAMRDFFDMFSHRQLSFFYRAWEKYFLAAGFEKALVADKPELDLIRESLLSVVGFGTRQVRDRMEVDDDAFVYYGGHFTDRPNAESLRAMVADYLQLPAKVISMFGQWLVLPVEERSRLGRLDGHCLMGVDTIVGGRTWDPSSKFRIQIGPVNWKQFERLMPTGTMLVRICQFVRSYVGLEFDFDMQVILIASEIPMLQFPSRKPESDSAVKPYLGWNTWLCSKPPVKDSDDAVFSHDGSPIFRHAGAPTR